METKMLKNEGVTLRQLGNGIPNANAKAKPEIPRVVPLERLPSP